VAALQLPPSAVDAALTAAVEPPATPEALAALYRYRVPVTTDDGACAASKELAPEPFDLGRELFGTSDWAAEAAAHPTTATLQRLTLLVQELAKRTQVDWLGVYRLRQRPDGYRARGAAPPTPRQVPAFLTLLGTPSSRSHLSRSRYLLKLAYVGRPSRAVFPLNELFHDISNNSWVAMEARPKLIQDVAAYDGPYYACDGDVQSELCAPIVDPASGAVLGIIDAESFRKAHFTAERIAEVLQACADLGRCNLGFPVHSA